MRIAIYVRVSTSHQVQQQTIDQQLDRILAHVRTQGWTHSDEHIFRDDGYSGATLARPGLDRLRDQVRARAFDRILLTAPDRLARNYVHQMVLLEEFAGYDCQVEFLDRPMSDDPHDQLLLQIRGAVAEYERTLIAERMRRGRLAKLQAGLLLPFTHAPYGYRLDPERPRDPSGMVIEPAEAAVVAEVYALYLEPQTSLAKLANTLTERGLPTPFGKQCWSPLTIRGILRNPTYTGQLYSHRTRYRPARIRRSATHPLGQPHGSATPLPPERWIFVATIPAIVTQEQFDQVQAKLAQNQSFASRNNTAHQYLLRALVSCGRCLLACTARQRYYVCNGKSQRIHSRRDGVCRSRYIPAQQLDERVWRDLCDLVRHPEPIARALERARGGAWLPQELQARRENLRKGRAALRQQLDRLTDAYLRAVIPLEEYERRRQDLERKDHALAGQETHLAGETERQHEIATITASIEDFCRRIGQGLETATFEQRRQLVMLLIDRVIVTDAEVEIRYVLPTTSQSEHVRFCTLRLDYFHHPALRQHREALLPLRLLHDLHPPASALGGPCLQLRPLIGPIGIDHLQPRATLHHRRQHPLGPMHIRQIRLMDGQSPEQPQRVHRDVTLAPRDQFAAVEAPAGPLFSAVRTDWASSTAALGVRSRPSASRTSSRNASWIRSSRPFRFQRRKWSFTLLQGGRSCGRSRHPQPFFT
jgi:site-specific DNA recombinase